MPAAVGGYSTTPTPTPGMEVVDRQQLQAAVCKCIRTCAVDSGRPPRRGCGTCSARARRPSARVSGSSSTSPTAISPNCLRAIRRRPSTGPSTTPPSTRFRASRTLPLSRRSPRRTPSASQPVQENYNGTFMIQQKVGFDTVLEASYVFNLSKHTWVTHQLNPVAAVLGVQPRVQQPDRGVSASPIPPARS